MILIDKDRGVLTQAEEFLEGSAGAYVIQNEAKKASLSEVFRVHDYNYLMKVLEMTHKLDLTDNKILSRFGRLFSIMNILSL